MASSIVETGCQLPPEGELSGTNRRLPCTIVTVFPDAELLEGDNAGFGSAVCTRIRVAALPVAPWADEVD